MDERRQERRAENAESWVRWVAVKQKEKWGNGEERKREEREEITEKRSGARGGERRAKQKGG